MRYTNITILLIFIYSTIYAQTGFVRGYYVNNQQDTIHGYIEYRAAFSNSKKFNFKAEQSDKYITLKPSEVSSFVIDQQVYYERHSLNNGNRFFFIVLVKGQLSLLYHKGLYLAKDNEGNTFFISKNQSSIKEEDEKNKKETLKFLTKDCENFAKLYIDNKNNNLSLEEIFKRYNVCAGVLPTVPKDIKIKPKINIGVMGLVGSDNLFFNSTLEAADFDSETIFSGGVFSSLFIPKGGDRLRLIVEGYYTRSNRYSFFSDGQTNNDLFIKQSALDVPIKIRYFYHHLFFEAGIHSQFLLSQASDWRIETMDQNLVYTENGALYDMDTWKKGYVLGTGLKFQLFDHTFFSSIRYISFRETTTHIYLSIKE
ncbi:MAG: hypothetical protein OEY34_03215 [Cyclobacteriaceae bacterium]|nr:hypothetical protein [Cyclobacteriaceae bacterium]